MRKTASALITLLILASAILGIRHFVSAQSNTAVSGVSDGFQLSISVDKTQYSSGEDVNVTCAITNVSDQTLNFINQNGNSSFDFQVYNSTNNQVYSWFMGAYPLVNATVSLAPNESYTQTLVWTQESDNSRGFPQVPSGAYYIIGDLGEHLSYPLQTEPLNITIAVPASVSASANTTPTSTAAVPEFPSLAVIPLIVALFFVAIMIRHRKNTNLNP